MSIKTSFSRGNRTGHHNT